MRSELHADGKYVEASEGETTVSLTDFLGVVRNRLYIVLIVVAACVGATVALSLLQTPVYESSIRILVGQERGGPDAPRENVSDLQRLTQTMVEGVNSRPVAETVIQRLSLPMTTEEFVNEHLDAKQIAETQFIQINYSDSSPERAQEVANAIGDVFSEQVSEVSPSASAITATVWERAQVPTEPVSPNPFRNGLLALVAGLILGTGLALLLEYLDDSWRSPEEAERISGVPTFGVVPEFRSPAGKQKGGN